jgi:hypothetical protein
LKKKKKPHCLTASRPRTNATHMDRKKGGDRVVEVFLGVPGAHVDVPVRNRKGRMPLPSRWAAVALLAAVTCGSVRGCSNILVSPGATVDGASILAYNADDMGCVHP